LYATECCEKCKYFNTKIKELDTQVQLLESNEKESSKIKHECANVSKSLSLHKKQHEMLTFDDIEEIRRKFEKVDLCIAL
jgi:recombinational DNA repair protein RecT